MPSSVASGTHCVYSCGPGSSVSIATGYGLDCSGIDSRWGAKYSAYVQTGPGTHLALGTGSIPRVKSGRGVALNIYTILLQWLRKSRAIPLLYPMGCTDCAKPQCLYSTAIPLLPILAVQPVQSLSACTVQLYLYSPIGRTACTQPQCLYSTATPLLSLLAVQPVQSLSACTVQQYLYSPCEIGRAHV